MTVDIDGYQITLPPMVDGQTLFHLVGIGYVNKDGQYIPERPKIGLYKVKWTEEHGGGESQAAIYYNEREACVIPTNWIGPAPLRKIIGSIHSITRLPEPRPFPIGLETH